MITKGVIYLEQYIINYYYICILYFWKKADFNWSNKKKVIVKY